MWISRYISTTSLYVYVYIYKKKDRMEIDSTASHIFSGYCGTQFISIERISANIAIAFRGFV